MNSNDTRVEETDHPVSARTAGIVDRMARAAAIRLLRRLQVGELSVLDWTGTTHCGAGDPRGELNAQVTIHDHGFYRELLMGGTLGAAEAYMDGCWTCSDLPAVFRIFVRNQRMTAEMDKGLARLKYPLSRLLHWLRTNTLRGSRRNIAAHYDLSNEFFAQFLDNTMTYSCAIFEREDSTLAEASSAKLDRVCRKLALTPRDHVLEIGTGWGSFAIHAASRYGCRITTTTISKQQYDFARDRIREAGVGDRVEVLLEDYRELRGTFDKIASIEMIEAVGYQYLDVFFKKCSDLLKPDGTMALQAITMADQEHERSKKRVDFIKRYIFPGGCVLSVTAMIDALTRATDMRLIDLEDITPHYAKTLRMWRKSFCDNLNKVRDMGFDERFVRMWYYYLAYCEAGFTERLIGDVQMVLAKPLFRLPLLLGSPAPYGSA